MRCYVDSSVILRRLLRQHGVLAEWPKIEFVLTSSLVRLEGLRTIDRLRLRGALSDDLTMRWREEFLSLLETVGLLPLTQQIFRRAEQPFVTPLSSLDALHLASALFWRETRGDDLIFATHDEELAVAARRYGFTVVGA